MPRRYTAHHPGATGGSLTGQTGAALIVGLILLTAFTLLSLSGMRNVRL